MFSVLAVGYLFLGGAGAGAIAVASILDLAWVKAPFGHASRIGIGEATPLERTVAVGMLAGFGALALGMLFLLFDLGRIDRVTSLLLRPSLSFLTVGTYTLAGLAACAALLVAVRFAYLPSVPRGAVRAVEAAAAVVAVVVMLYTGLLLQNTGAVALWSSPLVPVLFLLSSLSCGIAALLLAAYFAPADAGIAWLFRTLARADAVIVVLEAVAAALFVAFALADDHPGGGRVRAASCGGRLGFVVVGGLRAVRARRAAGGGRRAVSARLLLRGVPNGAGRGGRARAGGRVQHAHRPGRGGIASRARAGRRGGGANVRRRADRARTSIGIERTDTWPYSR